MAAICLHEGGVEAFYLVSARLEAWMKASVMAKTVASFAGYR